MGFLRREVKDAPPEESKSTGEAALPDPSAEGLQALGDALAFSDGTIGDSYLAQLTRGYEQNAYVARCVDLRAQSVAALLPIVTDRDGNEVEGDHPLKAIVARPNASQSWRELVTEIQTHLGINGNAYVYLVKTVDGLRLYAVRPDRIQPVMSTDPFDPVARWRIDGGRTMAKPEDVIHIHGVVGEDGVTGISPLQSAGPAVLQQTEAKRWNRALMEKGAKPSLAIIFRQKLTPKAFQDFAMRYRMQHQGTDNAGSTLILDEDANVVSAGFNARGHRLRQGDSRRLPGPARAHRRLRQQDLQQRPGGKQGVRTAHRHALGRADVRGPVEEAVAVRRRGADVRQVADRRPQGRRRQRTRGSRR